MLLQFSAPPGTLINRDQGDAIDAIDTRFIDIREHQRRLKSNGVELTSEADENGAGPVDPRAHEVNGRATAVVVHRRLIDP
jgi:hypothetical protein